MICLDIVKWLNRSIWPIDGSLTGTTTPDRSGLGSNGNKGVLYISQSSRTEASFSDGLVSYPGRLLEVGVFSHERDKVGVFYSPSQLGWLRIEYWNVTYVNE